LTLLYILVKKPSASTGFCWSAQQETTTSFSQQSLGKQTWKMSDARYFDGYSL